MQRLGDVLHDSQGIAAISQVYWPWREVVSCVTFEISWPIAFLWGIWKLKFLLTPSLTLTALKMQFVRRLRTLRTTLYVASWLVYLEDGSNALTVMEDIS
jgi:hypothetical protein